MNLRRLRIAVLPLAAALCLAGCATSSYNTAVQHNKAHLAGHEVADANNDGAYVSAGPITYQLQISRVLNPWAVEDSQFFKGLPAGTDPGRIPADELWYGVFLWAKNQHHHPYTTSDNFIVTDTDGHIYRPLKLDASQNPLAWSAQTLTYGTTEPGQDSIASNIDNGKLLLFKMNVDIFDNRPLTLYILSPTGTRIGSISLDD